MRNIFRVVHHISVSRQYTKLKYTCQKQLRQKCLSALLFLFTFVLSVSLSSVPCFSFFSLSLSCFRYLIFSFWVMTTQTNYNKQVFIELIWNSLWYLISSMPSIISEYLMFRKRRESIKTILGLHTVWAFQCFMCVLWILGNRNLVDKITQII